MKKRFGFTLVEVMVAVALFAFGLLGVFSIGQLMHRSSMSNLADGIALHAVEGMMEQIRAMPYDNVLAKAATDPKNNPLDFIRYKSATNTEAAGPVSQKIYANTTAADAGKTTFTDSNKKDWPITVNADGFMVVEGINLSTQLNDKFIVQGQSPMIFEVRVVLTPKDKDFAAGIAVEMFYRFKTNPGGDYKTHVVRTFIPRFLR